jgi:hypothetical protein
MKENQLNAKESIRQKRRVGIKAVAPKDGGTKKSRKPALSNPVLSSVKDVLRSGASKPIKHIDLVSSKTSTSVRSAKKASGGLQIASPFAKAKAESNDVFNEAIETVNLTKWIIGFITTVAVASFLVGFLAGRV